MSYTTYLFDFDYTLADSSRGIVTCFRNVLTRHEYLKVTDDEIKRTIGKTLQDSFSILTGVTDPEQLEVFRKEYVKEADVHMTVNTVLFLETKSVLIALKDAGARIGIISTKYRYRIKELLDQHFPTNFMDIIVGGEDVKAAKPSPEGLLFAIKQLRVTKAETLYIGDSTIDAETAEAAEVDFAGVTHGVTTAKELSKYPHWKIMSTLDELLDGDDKQLSVSDSDSEMILLPENDSPAPRKRKMINIWQILLLLFFLWLTYEEGNTSETWVFMTIFILTLWGILQNRRLLPDKVTAFIEPWWKPYRIRLRAFHIKLIRGRENPSSDGNPCTCQNCGTSYHGNFCNRCGQTRNTPRYHLSNACKNIVGGFTNIDNGFGRTLIELLYRPGYMIRDFIGGKRVHYFRPFQTLFVLAALYIMGVQLVDPEALSRNEKQDEKQIEQNDSVKIIAARDKLLQGMENATTAEEKKVYSTTIKSLEKQLERTTKKDSTAVVKYVDTDKDFVDDFVDSTLSVTDKLEQYLQHSPFLLKVWNLMKSWGHGNKAFRIIATLPLFALATLLAFRRRKQKLAYNLTEHVFIQAFIACQILLISIIVLPFNGSARVDDLYEVSYWFIFFLFWWDYKQLYRSTWWRSFWKTLLMFFYSSVLVTLFAILVILLLIAGVYLLKPLL